MSIVIYSGQHNFVAGGAAVFVESRRPAQGKVAAAISPQLHGRIRPRKLSLPSA
jgi:hypothetical protein